MQTIDHVCLAGRNLYDLAARLRESSGWETYDGGWMPGSGLGMRIVPIPAADQYLEVVSVIDHRVADSSPYGRWFGELTCRDVLAGWTMRVATEADLTAIGNRLGLPVIHAPLVRLRPDGYSIRLSAVGDTNVLWRRGLPNFVWWHDMAEHPGRTQVAHRRRPAEIVSLTVGGDANELAAWLGPGAPIERFTVVDAPPGVVSAIVRTEDGEVVVQPGVLPGPPEDRNRDWHAGAKA